MNIKSIYHSHSGPMKTFPHEGLSGGEKNSIKFRKDNVLRFFFFSTLHLFLSLEFPRRGVMAFCPFQFLLITATAETKGRKKRRRCLETHLRWRDLGCSFTHPFLLFPLKRNINKNKSSVSFSDATGIIDSKWGVSYQKGYHGCQRATFQLGIAVHHG